MNQDRAGRVWSSIARCARRQGARLSVEHVCLACAEALSVEVALIVVDSAGAHESVWSTQPRGEELAELQYTLGEGPCLDAIRIEAPVLVPDLTEAAAGRRWPLFSAGAVRLGIRANFAIPIQVGTVHLGVLDLYRGDPGGLGVDELGDVLLYADAALVLMLDSRGRIDGRPDFGVHDFTERRAEVHQAAGMMSVQLGTSVADALVRLRAHAYSNGRRLSDVARDVVTRRLRFEPDAEPPPLPADGTEEGRV